MDIVLVAVRLAFLLLSLSAIWFYLTAIYCAYDFFKTSSKPDQAYHPPVSILKPIRGTDSFAYENLASFCRQDYPAFQLIFGVLDENDPGLETVRQIAADFPRVDIRIVACPRLIGTNLKVSNLANMAQQASFPILVIADSDIRVEPDYLKRVIQPLADSQTGVVTSMYRSRAKGFISSIEALGISGDFHAGVLVARKLQGVKFAFGSTIAIKREVLESIGGFAAIADYLADDFFLGSLPAQKGCKVVLSDYVVEHVVDSERWLDFFKHQIRWGRTTRACRPAGYAGLIVTHGVATSFLFMLATGGSRLGWSVMAATWAIRIMMGLVVGALYLKDRAVTRYFWLMPARDLITFALWLYTFVGNKIEWRGKRFKLAKGGKLIPLE